MIANRARGAAVRCNKTTPHFRNGGATLLEVHAGRSEPRPSKFLRSILFLGLIFLAVPVQAAIHYTVSVEHPEQHLFHVTMEIPDVSDEVIVAMPAWNALYQVRDFAMHVQRVNASVGDKPVPIEKTRQADLADHGERDCDGSLRHVLE